DFHVTGVQTCALPISRLVLEQLAESRIRRQAASHPFYGNRSREPGGTTQRAAKDLRHATAADALTELVLAAELHHRAADCNSGRSEERRVGKECSSGG